MAWSGTQDYHSFTAPVTEVVICLAMILDGRVGRIPNNPWMVLLYWHMWFISLVTSYSSCTIKICIYIYICACVFNTSISTWLVSRYCNCSTQSHTPDRMDKFYMKEFFENHWADRTKGTVPLGWARMTEHTQLAKVLLLHQAKNSCNLANYGQSKSFGPIAVLIWKCREEPTWSCIMTTWQSFQIQHPIRLF